jgi:hypothetical protein
VIYRLNILLPYKRLFISVNYFNFGYFSSAVEPLPTPTPVLLESACQLADLIPATSVLLGSISWLWCITDILPAISAYFSSAEECLTYSLPRSPTT